MHLRFLTLVVVIIIFSGCTPTPQSAGTPTTGCAFSPNQTGNDLRLTCTVTGALPNFRLDPLVSGNAPCGINSWIVFSQTVSTPMVAIYGQNGDDSNARVRVGVTLGPGTHAGSIAKDNPICNSTTVGPSFGINTTFAGTHVALVDKGRTPMCVFESAMTLGTFNQTLTAGIPLNISGMTSNSTRDALQKRVDLEIAKAVNALLSPSSLPLSDAMISRGGRCDNDWHPFTGN